MKTIQRIALVALSLVAAGCVSMALKSDNAETRLEAIKKIIDQNELLDVALDKDYQNDVRLNAIQRLNDQHKLWRVWCENGENQIVSDEALNLLTDEMLLARVALLHPYEESEEEKLSRESAETQKSWAAGLTAVAVNVGGSAAASKMGDVGGDLAITGGNAAANIGLSAVFGKDCKPSPSMSVRTNDALVAVSRLKSESVISNVAWGSTIPCVHKNAYRKFLRVTDCIEALKVAVMDGDIERRWLVGNFNDDIAQNRILAIKKIFDTVVLKELLHSCCDNVATRLVFARMIQLKQYEAVVDALCEHDIQKLLVIDSRSYDVTKDNAGKFLRWIDDTNLCKTLVLRSRSMAIARAAVNKISDDEVLVRIVEEMDGGRDSIAQAAVDRISDEQYLEPVILANARMSRYAAKKLSDEALALASFKKVKDIDLRKILVEKIPVSEISADFCMAKEQRDVRRELYARATDVVKIELAQRRRAMIAKVLPVAQSEANDLLWLFAKAGMSKDHLRAFERVYHNRILVFRNATVWNNDCTSGSSAHRVLFSVVYPSKALVNSNKSIFFYGDFWNNFKEDSKRLVEFKTADVVVLVKGSDSTFYASTDAAVLNGNDDVSILEDFLGNREDVDDILEAMLSAESDRTVLKLAREVELDFAENVQSGMQDNKPSIGDTLKLIGEIGKKVDEVKEAKEELGKAWSDMKSELKKGVSDAISDKDRQDIKKSMDELKSATEALKNLGL